MIRKNLLFIFKHFQAENIFFVNIKLFNVRVRLNVRLRYKVRVMLFSKFFFHEG